jgi:hypothetical protein
LAFIGLTHAPRWAIPLAPRSTILEQVHLELIREGFLIAISSPRAWASSKLSPSWIRCHPIPGRPRIKRGFAAKRGRRDRGRSREAVAIDEGGGAPPGALLPSSHFLGPRREPGRCRPDVAPEVSRKVRLIVEPDTGRHLRDGLPIEETPACGIDPSRHDVAMRGDPEGTGEAPHQVRPRHVEDLPGVGEGERLEAVLIEQVPQIGRDVVIGALDGFGDPSTEMLHELRADDREHRLGLEGLARVRQHAVE